MKKLILATAAAFVLTAGFANAGIILQNDENDRKVWINTWAGQSADKDVARRYGSSVSTFSGGRSHGGLILTDDENDRKSVTNLWAGQREAHSAKTSESVSTFSGRHSPGTSIRGKFKNSHEVWINRPAR